MEGVVMMKNNKYETPDIEITKFEPNVNVMLNENSTDNENFDGDHVNGYESPTDADYGDLPTGW